MRSEYSSYTDHDTDRGNDHDNDRGNDHDNDRDTDKDTGSGSDWEGTSQDQGEYDHDSDDD